MPYAHLGCGAAAACVGRWRWRLRLWRWVDRARGRLKEADAACMAMVIGWVCKGVYILRMWLGPRDVAGPTRTHDSLGSVVPIGLDGCPPAQCQDVACLCLWVCAAAPGNAWCGTAAGCTAAAQATAQGQLSCQHHAPWEDTSSRCPGPCQAHNEGKPAPGACCARGAPTVPMLLAQSSPPCSPRELRTSYTCTAPWSSHAACGVPVGQGGVLNVRTLACYLLVGVANAGAMHSSHQQDGAVSSHDQRGQRTLRRGDAGIAQPPFSYQR